MKTESDFYVVGMEAYASGPEAVKKFLDLIPFTDFSLLLNSHLDTDLNSLLVDLRAEYPDMKAITVDEDQKVEMNTIYLNKNHAGISILQNHFIVGDETSDQTLQSPIHLIFQQNHSEKKSKHHPRNGKPKIEEAYESLSKKYKELESQFRDTHFLFDSTDIGTLILDTDLKIRKFTPALQEVFSLDESDIGRSITCFATDFNSKAHHSMVEDSKEALQHLKSFEKEIQDELGNWYLKRINPIVTNGNQSKGVAISFVDINHLKKVKQDLYEIEKRLNIALEAGNMAWWEMELPSGKINFSQNKTRLLGFKSENFLRYSDFMKRMHPDDYNGTMNAMKNHLRGITKKYDCEYRLMNSKGEYQWFHDIGKIVTEIGDKTIVSGMIMEITSKKQTELQLVEAKQKAELANLHKNQFLANMSHEIRTPMNGLVGFASLLRDEDLDVVTRNRFIDIIESSANQLMNLINDIIDISKIEAGQLKIGIKPCNMERLFLELETTFNELKNQKRKSNLVIKAEIPEAFKDLNIKTDPARIKQVLTNLIGNALKFTETGGITFGYTITDANVVCTVTDTGIGMSKDKLNVIFERFQQLDQLDGPRQEGTGLGLAISKGIITLLGGNISVISEKGEGSTFTFSIPFIPAGTQENAPNQLPKSVTKKLQDKKVLIAEDDKYIQIYLEEILKQIPMEIVWAQDGKEAVEVFKQNLDVSIILMDIRLPQLDGYQAARKILEIKPDTHIIAQTAHAMTSDKQKFIKHGFVDYITKPINKTILWDTLAKWVKN